MKSLLMILSVVLLAGCGGSETPSNNSEKETPTVIQPTNPVTPLDEVGVIVGEVKFVGTPPAPEKLKPNKDEKVCGTEKLSEELMVGLNKGIKNAVVSVENVYGIPVKPETVVLDQKGCQFRPHVLLVPQGGTVKILNPDGVLHNFHSDSHANPVVNKAQPKFKKEMDEKFDTPEIIKIKCDVHSWMSGLIVVTGHPYFTTTDNKGSFKIENVPAGIRVLKVWHESLGEQVLEVKVNPGQESKVVIEMKLK